MVKILSLIFSKEIPISLEEQAEIDRRVELFKQLFYKKLSVLEQQPSGEREELAKNFLDEIKTFFKENTFAMPVEDHPKDPQERKMWEISDQYHERIAKVIRPQAERYGFYEDSFWKKFGRDLSSISPTKGMII
jgi:hypothetical protein